VRGSSPRRLILGALVVAASFSRAAFAAPGCKVESIPELGAAEVQRVSALPIEGFDGNVGDADVDDEKTVYFAVDIDNDGKSEFVSQSFAGSAGYLVLAIFSERNGKVHPMEDPPPPRGMKRDGPYGPWFARGPGPIWLLKLCDKNLIGIGGTYPSAIDGYLWKGGKTVPVCEPDWTAHQLSMFDDRYGKREFEDANGILRSYLAACGARLPAETRRSILSSLAITAFHLGHPSDCLAYVRQAKQLPGFASSRSKAAVLFNEATCAKPPGAPVK
jgi:hypothetical protein